MSAWNRVQPGEAFGRLRALNPTPERSDGSIVWACLCDPDLGGCGAPVLAKAGRLRGGHVQSCGCLQRERASEAFRKVGRARWGKGKIGPGEAEWIRQRVAAGECQAELARRCGVTKQAINEIVRGRTHLPRPPGGGS